MFFHVCIWPKLVVWKGSFKIVIAHLHFILVWFFSLIWITDGQLSEESQKHKWYWTMHNGMYNVIFLSIRVWFWMQSKWVVLSILDFQIWEKVVEKDHSWINQVPSSNRWKRRPHVHMREINMLTPYKIKRRYKLQTLENMIIGLIDWFTSICSVDWKILATKMKLNLTQYFHSMNY